MSATQMSPPGVAIMPCNLADLAVEVIALGRREGLAAVVEERDGAVAREARRPHLSLGVDGQPETRAEKAAAGEAGDGRRERRAVGGELGEAPRQK